MATTFPKFLQLPPEIRSYIWTLTVQPRTVVVRARPKRGQPQVAIQNYRVASVTPVPAALQACRESRAELCRGEQAYQKLSIVDGPDEPYVWVSFDIDIVELASTGLFTMFQNCGHRIRRLMFEGDDLLQIDIHLNPRVFSQLEQCFVIIPNGWEWWDGSLDVSTYTRSPRRFFIIDPDRNMMISAPRLRELQGPMHVIGLMNDDQEYDDWTAEGTPMPAEEEMAAATLSL